MMGPTVYLLVPLTKEAEGWCDRHFDTDVARLGNNIAIEHRFVMNIVDGIRADGMVGQFEWSY